MSRISVASVFVYKPTSMPNDCTKEDIKNNSIEVWQEEFKKVEYASFEDDRGESLPTPVIIAPSGQGILLLPRPRFSHTSGESSGLTAIAWRAFTISGWGVLGSAVGKAGPQPPAPSRPRHSLVFFSPSKPQRGWQIEFPSFFSLSMWIKLLRLYFDRTSSGLFWFQISWTPSVSSIASQCFEILNPASASPSPSKLTVPVAVSGVTVCGNFGLLLAVISYRLATEKPPLLPLRFFATASAVFLHRLLPGQALLRKVALKLCNKSWISLLAAFLGRLSDWPKYYQSGVFVSQLRDAHEIRFFNLPMFHQQPPLLRVNGAWHDFSLILGLGLSCSGLRSLPLYNVLRSCLTLLITKGEHAACLCWSHFTWMWGVVCDIGVDGGGRRRRGRQLLYGWLLVLLAFEERANVTCFVFDSPWRRLTVRIS